MAVRWWMCVPKPDSVVEPNSDVDSKSVSPLYWMHLNELVLRRCPTVTGTVVMRTKASVEIVLRQIELS